MEIVLATQKLTEPGGAPTYALTLAEHLARLGHGVTLYARELGAMAELAAGRALRVTGRADELPEQADAVISGVDRSLALELAGRYPQAMRLFVVHGSEDIHLPPPAPGAVAATIALNDHHATRAGACVGAGEVVRMRQPVDLRRFSPNGAPAEQPRRVLLLGNYHSVAGGRRRRMLQEAWSGANLQWREAGGGSQTLAVAEAIAEADIVVGYGRSVLEAMSCGRPAYVHDHSGSEGWITPESYPALERGGFAVAVTRMPPSGEQLAADLAAYRPELGLAGHDIARARHDARDHAAAVVELIERLGPGRALAEPSAVRAMAQLAESQLRAELAAEHYRMEAKQWFALYNETLEEKAQERGAAQLREEEAARLLAGERRAAAEVSELTGAFRRTRRYRLAQALAEPLERLRARRRS